MEIDILATLVENFEKCPPLTNFWIRACNIQYQLMDIALILDVNCKTDIIIDKTLCNYMT